MKHEYTVGMSVRTRPSTNRGVVLTGVVTEADDDCEIMVQWDNREEYPAPKWEETRFLIPNIPGIEEKEKECARQVQAKIDEATASIEAAFKAWKDAAELYGCERDYPYPLREDDLLDVSKFEHVLENNGWSTSSLYC